MNLQQMVKRILDLRQNHNIELTLLAVCPNSEAVLEAAIQAASRNNTPMLFAATLNQIDRDGGYTGWTPAQFVAKMTHYAKKYSFTGNLLPCLDHGGPWQKDQHRHQGLSFEATTQEVKDSIVAVLAAGYTLLHIDATLNPSPALDVIVAQTLELVEFAEHERIRLGLPPIAYEIGTEAVQGGVTDMDWLQAFLNHFYQGLADRDLVDAMPAFIEAQLGTDLHTVGFDAGTAQQIFDLASPHGALAKGHYTDWVDNIGDYPSVGIGGANVGPELTAIEYDALLSLAAREAALVRQNPHLVPSNITEILTNEIIASNRWQKWLQPHEHSLYDLTQERRHWILQTCARYIWTVPNVITARERLYNNLAPTMNDPHQWVVMTIAAAIERYIVAFNLFNANAYFTNA